MPSTIIPPDYYATASTLFDYTSHNATLKITGANTTTLVPTTTTIIPPPEINAQATVYIYGFCLILIPIATLLGNLLVIVSVLRFKALHSAINFLILGLAVADLLVAFLVMPYAVLVYVQGGYWFLGPLMCDIYSASDVACSTASILLLAVISFDRYRAVSRPIQYSRQSQNIRRVVIILIAIWFISLALASPIVLGVNYRPEDANPYECRFYNPEFSIMSSMISFVIPCFIVLFVYIRIMMALRKREKAAKARRQANSQTDGEKKGDLDDGDEAGQIVAGPDDHDLAGSLTPRSSTDSLSENVNVVTNDFISEGPTSVSRRSSEFDSSFANNTMSSFNSSNLNDRSERSNLSEYKRKKHLQSSFYFHRRSSTMPAFDRKSPQPRSASVAPSRSPLLPNFLRQLSKRSPRFFRGTSPKQDSTRKHVHPKESPFTKVSRVPMGDIAKPVPEEAVIIENNATGTPDSLRKLASKRNGEATTEEEMDQLIPSTTDTETASAVMRAHESETPSPPSTSQGAIIRRSPLTEQKFATASVARQLFFERNASIDENQELLVDCTVATTDASGKLDLVIENENAKDETPKHQTSATTAAENRRIKNLQNRDDCGSPSVSFNIAGKTFFGGREHPLGPATPFERNSRRRSSCMETWSESNKHSESMGFPSSVSSNMISSDASVPGIKNRMFIKQRTRQSKSQQSIDSNPSISSSTKLEAKKKLLGNPKLNGSSTALAVRIVKRTMHRKESSLKRKVTKAQRKERRATKTLGIVVGIFLICWVPFFTINILNAVCVKLEEEWCQVGFGPFFYATWIGYMNSFMNPVIYTIFNTEFRRAFKSIILGRNAARRHRARNV